MEAVVKNPQEQPQCLPEKGSKKNKSKEYLKEWIPYRIKR